MKGDNYVFGMIGLGTMGRNLLLNMADHGFKVTGHDKDAAKVHALASANVKGFTSVYEFVDGGEAFDVRTGQSMHLSGVFVMSSHLEPMISHVEQQVAAHRAQTDHSKNIVVAFHGCVT